MTRLGFQNFAADKTIFAGGNLRCEQDNHVTRSADSPFDAYAEILIRVEVALVAPGAQSVFL